MELARDDTRNSRAFIYPACHACTDQSGSLSLSLYLSIYLSFSMCVCVCVFHPENRLFRGPCEPLDCFFCRIVLLSREKPIIFFPSLPFSFFTRRCNFFFFFFFLLLAFSPTLRKSLSFPKAGEGTTGAVARPKFSSITD